MKNRAQLVRVVTAKGRTTYEDRGQYYISFNIDVTSPEGRHQDGKRDGRGHSGVRRPRPSHSAFAAPTAVILW